MENLEQQHQPPSRFERDYPQKFSLWKSLIQDSIVTQELKNILLKHLQESGEPHQFIVRFASELDSIGRSWSEYDDAMKQELKLGIKNTHILPDNLRDPYTLYAELRKDQDITY